MLNTRTVIQYQQNKLMILQTVEPQKVTNKCEKYIVLMTRVVHSGIRQLHMHTSSAYWVIYLKGVYLTLTDTIFVCVKIWSIDTVKKLLINFLYWLDKMI
jgi:hypothetical protein